MSVETIKSYVNLKDYFDKMTPEDSAAIATMCLDRLIAKANELKELYVSLAKTYGFEMGVCGITCIVQISANNSPIQPTLGLFGTSKDIQKGLAKLTVTTLDHLAKMNKEEANDDRKQG